jgi:hypothetical protein
LTTARDIFPACNGIISALGTAFKTFKRVRDNTPLIYLDIALLWYPTNPLVRRCDADEFGLTVAGSWNWAGWVGGAIFPEGTFSECVNPCMTWYEDSTKTSQTLPGNVFGQARRDPNVPSGWNQQRRVGTVSNDLKGFSRRYTEEGIPEKLYDRLMPPEDELLRLDKWLQSLDSGISLTYLHVGTSVATLAVSSRHIQSWRSLPNGNKIGRESMKIEDSNGVQIGYVTIDGNTARKIVPGKYDFIKLSKTPNPKLWWDTVVKHHLVYNHTDFIDDSYFDSDVYQSRLNDREIEWPLYNVMMVEWERDVATRLGIGRCHVRAFDAVASEYRRFRLG